MTHLTERKAFTYIRTLNFDHLLMGNLHICYYRLFSTSWLTAPILPSLSRHGFSKSEMVIFPDSRCCQRGTFAIANCIEQLCSDLRFNDQNCS